MTRARPHLVASLSALGVASALGAFGCRAQRQEPSRATAPDTSASSAAAPVDRLTPGELAPGKAVVFGFPVPREMKLEHLYPDAAHIGGNVSPEAVANYVRTRVKTRHVEIGAARTVFPAVSIDGDPTRHTYRIEVIAMSGGRTVLLIRDITAPPMVEGLSQDERWKRAGLSPDGKILDPRSLE